MRTPLHIVVEASERYESISYRHSDDDVDAWTRFASTAMELAGGPGVNISYAFWSGRWRHDGFPRVVIGPRRAATLAATGVTSEQMELIRPIIVRQHRINDKGTT